MRDDRPFAFGGLWEHWESGAGEAIDSCTLLTMEPNELIRTFHHWMPVILEKKDYALWLDPAIQDPPALHRPARIGVRPPRFSSSGSPPAEYRI